MAKRHKRSNVEIHLGEDPDPLVISASRFKIEMVKANDKTIMDIEIRKVCEGGN